MVADPRQEPPPAAAELVPALWLMHPDANAAGQGAVVLADTQPPAGQGRSRPADVVLLDLTEAGRTDGGRLASLVERLADRLAPDGVAYLPAAPGAGPRIRRMLGRHRLMVAEVRLPLHIWNGSLALVPVAQAPVRYALAGLMPKPSARARLAALVGRQIGGPRWLSRLMPAVGLVVRRPGARPLFDWLNQQQVMDGPVGPVILKTSGSRADGPTMLYCFLQGQASPSAVVKVGAAGHDLEPEQRHLTELGPQASRDGAAVPRPLGGAARLGDRQVLIQTAVEGQVAAALLISEPQRLPAVLERLLTWLERWNQATRVMQVLTGDRLRDDLLAPAARLLPQLDGGQGYAAWLAGQCAALAGRSIPWVAVHNDLTLWNVLIDGRAGLGVVDWESACAAGWPLTDLFYAVVDGVVATRGYRDRPAAFQACFSGAGWLASLMANWQQRLCQSLEITPDVAQLCWHACWLRHAANEERAAAAGAARPFLQIVQLLARQPRFLASTDEAAELARPVVAHLP